MISSIKYPYSHSLQLKYSAIQTVETFFLDENAQLKREVAETKELTSKLEEVLLIEILDMVLSIFIALV